MARQWRQQMAKVKMVGAVEEKEADMADERIDPNPSFLVRGSAYKPPPPFKDNRHQHRFDVISRRCMRLIVSSWQKTVRPH